jgi:hypothetical protein
MVKAMGENLTSKLLGWYPDLFEPATMHAEDYVGYPDVQSSILFERDLRERIGNLPMLLTFVVVETPDDEGVASHIEELAA